MELNPRLDHSWWTLRIALGAVPIIAGLDKFLNLLTNWEMYLNPLIPKMLHISQPTFMHISGVVEIVVGILMFTRFTRYIAYVVMVWLWAISLNLISQGQFFDIAVRDIVISLGAFVLAKLTEVREMAAVETSQPRKAASDEMRRTA
jgi:uncharacterized membrane protein YphA (DoxX/SURF4 family)